MSNSAFSLTVPKLTFLDLARESDTVFRGHLSNTNVRSTADGKWILTDYFYSVSRCYRMTTETCPKTIRVTLPGGQIGRRYFEIPGTPQLGRWRGETIFFLSHNVPTGITQGIFRVNPDGNVGGQPLREMAPQGMPLDYFERWLEHLLISSLSGNYSSPLETSMPLNWSTEVR